MNILQNFGLCKKISPFFGLLLMKFARNFTKPSNEISYQAVHRITFFCTSARFDISEVSYTSKKKVYLGNTSHSYGAWIPYIEPRSLADSWTGCSYDLDDPDARSKFDLPSQSSGSMSARLNIRSTGLIVA